MDEQCFKFEMSTYMIEDKNLKNLYYLDEMIKSMITGNVNLSSGEKYETFLRDWYQELKDKVGHTDEEREKHLRVTFGDEWFDDGEFLSIEERNDFLAATL